ncbi:MAG: alpha-amylase family protein [Prevotella sp.]|nr:alpha-amylase family protein [Prevotella sp.]MCM1074685.1 alpha-amylase family protein [Ruminococcus sp.]
MEKEKLIIYQVLPRLFTNMNKMCQPFGTLAQNGSGKMNDISDKVLRSIKNLGVNCVWYTGIIEHSTKEEFPGIPADNPHIVKGQAGSPYAIKDYYDVAPELAENIPNRMNEFQALVKRTHKAGMKVIIDFVPNHTARIYHSDVAPYGVKDFGVDDDTTKFFSSDNNYYYLTNQKFQPRFDIGDYDEFPAKATGNDAYTAFPGEYDWYETVKLNYGYDPGNGFQASDPAPDTWIKMLSILRFWASKGIDGFRCDMVFMVPLVFWNWALPQLKKDYPHLIFIGEIYNVGLYRPFLDYCGFDYLYDKVNLYDTLVGIETQSLSAARLTDCWQTVDGIAPKMLNFLENHDEVRFGSVAYAGNPSKVLPSLVVSSMINTGPFMVYFGQEIGECALDNEGFAGNNNRTTIFDFWSYDTLRRWYDNGRCTVSKLTQKEKWLRGLYTKILHLCNQEKAIREGSFFDLMYVNLNNDAFSPHTNFAFLRHFEDETLLIAVNFADTSCTIKINIPDAAFEMLDLPQGAADSIDLLTDNHKNITLQRGVPIPCTITGKGAVIWKIKHSEFAELNKIDGEF